MYTRTRALSDPFTAEREDMHRSVYTAAKGHTLLGLSHRTGKCGHLLQVSDFNLLGEGAN